MPSKLGQIEAIFRYPVKSMRGESLDAAAMGWHGLENDRRLALHRLGERGGKPWLSASKLPEMVRWTPQAGIDGLPTHVTFPEGTALPVFAPELAAEVGRRFGSPVEMMRLDHGVFDETAISVITSATVREICRLATVPDDIRRFRPNIVVRSERGVPFEENDWVGGVLAFGDTDDAPAVTVTMRDERCAIVNIDPDTAAISASVMKVVVRANDNYAGVYGAVATIGRLAIGQTVVLRER